MSSLPLPPAIPTGAALFVDFDGTLAPIAARPQDVRVPNWVVPVLGALQRRQGGALALVSGRPLAQIDQFLQPLVPAAAGVHGAERRGVTGRLEVQTATPPPAAMAGARALAQAHAGLLLEPKPGGFALHYRERPELEALCREALQAALEADAPQRDWELMQGHCVFELKQRRVSKGTALRAFMAEAPFAGRHPIYAGDDVTDEDGIEAAQALGGWGVRVGPGATVARYRLADVDAVGRWLGAAVTAEVLPFEADGVPSEPASRPEGPA